MEFIMKKLAQSEFKGLTAGLNAHGLMFSGFNDIMPNPDPILKKLGWNKDVEAYIEIMSDPQLYGAIENNRKPGVKSMLRYIDNEKADPAEIEFFNNYFNQLIRNGIYDNVTSYTLDTPYFGRSIMGIVWGEVEGYFLPIEITPIPLRLCKFNEKGELRILNETGSFSPPAHTARFITLKHKPTIDNPYGEAILSKCYWNVKFKKEGRKLWAMFVEKFGMPWVTGSYNPNAIANAFSTDIDTASQMLLDNLSTMARDGVIIFPDGTNVNLLSGSNSNASDVYERLVRICDEQNTKLILGHSGATESTSGDKLSNDTTATDVRRSIIDADKTFPITFWNKLIEWIHYFNFNGNERPIFDLYTKEDVDMQYAERDAKLAPVLLQSGKKLSTNYFIKTYGFDESDIEELGGNYIEPIQPNAISPVQIYAQRKSEFNDQTLIDNLADTKVENDDVTDDLIADIIEMVNNSDSYEELQDKIGNILEQLQTDKFQLNISQMLFLADVIGRISAKDERGLK